MNAKADLSKMTDEQLVKLLLGYISEVLRYEPVDAEIVAYEYLESLGIISKRDE